MAVLTPGAMKNKISFYRESMTVNNSGEKVKTVSIIKRDVGAEFKYIGTPSAGASEERIQEQRTGKIKAEIRCRYFKGVKFEDVIYFEGGKFRIYSIQYEGRHEVLKIRAELRDDDTYFGLPDQDYPFTPTTHQNHFRTSAEYQVVENMAFPKETGGNFLFETSAQLGYTSFDIGDGELENFSLPITTQRQYFPYTVDNGLAPPTFNSLTPDDKTHGYTVPFYDMYPSNIKPYTRVEINGEVIAETLSVDDIILTGGSDSNSPTWKTEESDKIYKITTSGFDDVDQALYSMSFGFNDGFVYYRLTPRNSVSYKANLNARDLENTPLTYTAGSVYVEYRFPIKANNLSLSFPTDIDERIFRQQGQIMGVVSTSSQQPITTVGATNKPKTGNVKVTEGSLVDDPNSLRVETINSVSVVDSNGVAVELDEEATALLDRFEITADTSAAGIAFVEGESLDSAWAGGEITFNVDFSPNTTTGSHSENTSLALGVDLTYKLV